MSKYEAIITLVCEVMGYSKVTKSNKLSISFQRILWNEYSMGMPYKITSIIYQKDELVLKFQPSHLSISTKTFQPQFPVGFTWIIFFSDNLLEFFTKNAGFDPMGNWKRPQNKPGIHHYPEKASQQILQQTANLTADLTANSKYGSKYDSKFRPDKTSGMEEVI